MATDSRKTLFRKRNILGTALIAGIGLGVYFGQFKGFGLGGGSQFGLGLSDGETQATIESPAGAIKPLDIKPVDIKPLDPENSVTPQDVSDVVRVLIDDRKFKLKSEISGAEIPVDLKKLIELIQQAPGDEDGLRVRIYRTTTSRASAEESLKQELTAAGIDETAIFWVPPPVK